MGQRIDDIPIFELAVTGGCTAVRIYRDAVEVLGHKRVGSFRVLTVSQLLKALEEKALEEPEVRRRLIADHNLSAADADVLIRTRIGGEDGE